MCARNARPIYLLRRHNHIMNYLTVVLARSRGLLLLLTLTILLSISYLARLGSASASGQMIQTNQTIDLGAMPNAANIHILGAAQPDHLSGNGAPGSFASFPRAHALATGDFNNDGFRDIVVGAPDADFAPAVGPTREDAGAVYIVFGRASFSSPTIIDTNLTAISQPDVKIFGAKGGDNLGFVVTTGVINADGIDDLAIG